MFKIQSLTMFKIMVELVFFQRRVQMKLKIFTMSCLLALFSCSYASNIHLHPEDTNKAAEKSATDKVVPSLKAKYAGFCEIEIVNNSFDDVRVYGTYDDGLPLIPFTHYSFEAPHYISMFYYGYCHYGMNLYIDSYYGYNLYSGYTQTGSTVRILPFLKNKAKAELSKR